MLPRLYKYFFYTIFFTILSITSILILNSNIRQKTLNAILNSYKIYMIFSVQSDLKKIKPDYIKINNKLRNFIKVSKIISSGKSRILITIYDSADIVQSSILENSDFGHLENFFSEFSELDPNLYDAKIWYARSLYANNKTEEAIQQINEAIKISSLDPDAYRLAMQIFSELNDEKNLIKYCKDYLEAELGGKQKRYQNTKFTGFNLNEFGVKLGSDKKNQNTYIINGINNNDIDEYEIIPSEAVDVDNINLIFTFMPGTTMEILKIKLFSKNKLYEINEKNFLINSQNALFLNNENQNHKIIFFNFNDEIISLKLNDKFNNIDKVVLVISFGKLNLTNLNC